MEPLSRLKGSVGNYTIDKPPYICYTHISRHSIYRIMEYEQRTYHQQPGHDLPLPAAHRVDIFHPAQPIAGKKTRLCHHERCGSLEQRKHPPEHQHPVQRPGEAAGQGLIERVPNDEDNSTGPGLPRKAYVLSKTGRHALEMEVSRMQGLVAVAKLHLSQEHP